MSGQSIPTAELQRHFWNEWNTSSRELLPLDEASLARAAFVISAVRGRVPPDGRLLDLGCGTGWLSEQLATLVREVTAVDLADEIIDRARIRAPHIRFLAGDAMVIPVDDGYDAVVCVDTLSHVPDQSGLINRVSCLLKQGGTLILTTQNRMIFNHSNVMPQGVGQIRHWVTSRELKSLLESRFRVINLTTILPGVTRGWLRILIGRKACQVWELLFGVSRWREICERMGLGQTITVIAQKK